MVGSGRGAGLSTPTCRRGPSVSPGSATDQDSIYPYPATVLTRSLSVAPAEQPTEPEEQFNLSEDDVATSGTIGAEPYANKTVSQEEASEGYTANDGTDQTPDADVYEHGGTVGSEEVSADGSGAAEQDPSLNGSGIMTVSDGTTQMDAPAARPPARRRGRAQHRPRRRCGGRHPWCRAGTSVR